MQNCASGPGCPGAIKSVGSADEETKLFLAECKEKTMKMAKWLWAGVLVMLVACSAQGREYKWFVDNIKEVLKDNDVIAISAFIAQLVDDIWMDELRAYLLSNDHVLLKIILVSVDDKTQCVQIKERASPLDDWKLRNWDAFMRETRNFESRVQGMPELYNFDTSKISSRKPQTLVRRKASDFRVLKDGPMVTRLGLQSEVLDNSISRRPQYKQNIETLVKTLSI